MGCTDQQQIRRSTAPNTRELHTATPLGSAEAPMTKQQGFYVHKQVLFHVHVDLSPSAKMLSKPTIILFSLYRGDASSLLRWRFGHHGSNFGDRIAFSVVVEEGRHTHAVRELVLLQVQTTVVVAPYTCREPNLGASNQHMDRNPFKHNCQITT